MAYIGNTATTQAFTPAVDYFNGDGATVAFTLSKPVASVAQVQAVIENVPQNPGSAYTVSGNTITFTSAPPSGTSNIYVYYTSPITQVIAPGQGTVSTSILQDGSVTSAKLATLTTLPAPSSNTLTLPSASGTIDRLNRAGNVLQVVSATTSTQVTSSVNTYADTGLTATITPTSATSKILVFVSQNGTGKSADNADAGIALRLLRDATQIALIVDRNLYTNSTLLQQGSTGITYLDSPSTTSSITYKTQFRCWNTAVAAVSVQGASSTSTITLMEIAA